MKVRKLGSGGLAVSAIGLGCMGMSQSYGPGDDEESTRTLHRALDLGVTLVDTADAYGRGGTGIPGGRASPSPPRHSGHATKFCLRRPARAQPGSVTAWAPRHV